jgi:hypothetical protein
MFGFKKRKPDQTNDQKDSNDSDEARDETISAEQGTSAEPSAEPASDNTPLPSA